MNRIDALKKIMITRPVQKENSHTWMQGKEVENYAHIIEWVEKKKRISTKDSFERRMARRTTTTRTRWIDGLAPQNLFETNSVWSSLLKHVH